METGFFQSFIRHARFPVLLVIGVMLYQFRNGPNLEPKFTRSKFLFQIIYLYFGWQYNSRDQTPGTKLVPGVFMIIEKTPGTKLQGLN